MTQLRNWCFTSYNDDPPLSEDPRIRYMVYQREQCPDTGRLHWQGYVEFERSVKLGGVKKVIGGKKPAHVEPRSGSRSEAREYCMVDEWKGKPKGKIPDSTVEIGEWNEHEQGLRTDLLDAKKKIQSHKRLRDVYNDDEIVNSVAKYPRWVETVFNLRPIEIPPPVITLYPWQEGLMEIFLQDPVHRRIIWIWSTESNTGKSTFKEYVSTKCDVLPAGGKLGDILYAYDGHDIIWFDFTRADEGYESYKTLEILSNHGYVFSSKYQSGRKYIKSHIVVTSNHPPDESKLPNRFEVYNVGEEGGVTL